MKRKVPVLFTAFTVAGLAFGQTGTFDASFNTGTGADNGVRTIAVQPDGKAVVGGNFTSFNGAAVNRIVRLNVDGSTDPGFGPGTGANDVITAVAMQADGKVLIAGSFTSYNGTNRRRVARLNADGTLDGTFNPGTGPNQRVDAIVVQPDGKVLIAGTFVSVNGSSRNRVARLNANGTLDGSFNPGTGANGDVKALALQPDGKVLVGGSFTSYNGTARNRLARVNADGGLDASYGPGTGCNAPVWDMVAQPDGRVVIAGEFSAYNGTTRNRIARTNADGSLDVSFFPVSGLFDVAGAVGRRLALHGGGKILVGGSFTLANGVTHNRIARFNTNGSVDSGFNSGGGASGGIWAVATRPNGKILVGGGFTAFASNSVGRVAQLNGDDCPVLGVNIGAPCDDGNPLTQNDVVSAQCVCMGDCGGNQVMLHFTTDANADQIGWEITDSQNNVLFTGGLTAGDDNSTVVVPVCLGSTPVEACYGFRLMDSFGDGIADGGWELRTVDGKLLLADDFANGSVSPAAPPASATYGGSHGFCLPEGPAAIALTECGIFTNNLLNKVYCNKVTGANQYQFEFADPDAGFIRRITTNRNYVIFNEMVSNPLTPGVTYFARVRSNVAGPVESAHFGSGCEMGLGIAETLTCSELISAPAYGHSCNEERTFNSGYSFIYAIPVMGATEYQFRIFNDAEGYDQTFSRNTYILELAWNNTVAPPLLDGNTYNVEINAKVSGAYTGFCPSTCTITINNAELGGRLVQTTTQAMLWPNPVQNGLVNLDLNNLSGGAHQISVDVQDIYGKRVFTQAFSNTGDRFSTLLQLPGTLSSGVYLVNITVDGTSTVHRVSMVD
ncbi:MAG: T9SS type A sorting domain-containing protein [Flavobacteriales bacterium]|nr:T9SS type A sorting domain-containing protein [Flavobacteriales bacterium]